MALALSGAAAEDAASALTIVVRLDRACTVVVLRGDADFYSRPALSEALSRVIGSRDGEVVVDLAGIRFIDTAGAGVLGIARDLLSRQARRLTVRSPSTAASQVLAVVGLSDLVEHTSVGDEPRSCRDCAGTT